MNSSSIVSLPASSLTAPVVLSCPRARSYWVDRALRLQSQDLFTACRNAPKSAEPPSRLYRCMSECITRAAARSIEVIVLATGLLGCQAAESGPNQALCASVVDHLAVLELGNNDADAELARHRELVARAIAPSVMEECAGWSNNKAECLLAASSADELAGCGKAGRP